MEINLVKSLFDTNALKVSPEDKPFWYTSGKIGPLYVNTHFLYGGEKSAVEMLSFIDEAVKIPSSCAGDVLKKCGENYINSPIYKNLIDAMAQKIENEINLSEIAYISGGERRDWFFSLIIAEKLNKPHLTMFKNGRIFMGENEAAQITGNVLHIADLITEASSYVRAWIPFIQKIGAVITHSLCVVDRLQGGSELIKSNNIESLCMIEINAALFDKAAEFGIVTESQADMLKNYILASDETMKTFIKNNPQFLQNALASDEKTKERAKFCLEKGFYK